eukprot:6443580-Lingulodinium_polyedra.AAC.1
MVRMACPQCLPNTRQQEVSPNLLAKRPLSMKAIPQALEISAGLPAVLRRTWSPRSLPADCPVKVGHVGSWVPV